ncbi:MAG: GntR family transcriptional regulator [Acidimicrobiales bacterium]
MAARKLGGTRAPAREPALTSERRAARRDAEHAEAVSAQPADGVYSQLHHEIVAGLLLPQQRLVEADLCARLQTSRATVREVLLRLEHEGLVVREPYRGAHVRVIDEKEAVEITQARAVLEALAARHAATMATDDDIAALRAIHTEMRTLIKAGDLWAYSDANRRLHACIIEVSRHATAQRLLIGLKAQLVRFQYRTIFVPGRAQQSLAEHAALVDAIVRGDPDRAEATMKQHLSGVATTLRSAAGREADTAISFG